jgi:polyferredoxin
MSLRSNARLALRKGRSNQHRVENMPSPVALSAACFVATDNRVYEECGAITSCLEVCTISMLWQPYRRLI